MIYTYLTNKAMKISYKAHMNQADKSGIAYVFHPYHLAEQMENEFECCVALLHDVVEDSSITIEDLKLEFPIEVVDAVDILTKKEGMDYFEYINRIKTNDLAKKVKIADLIHNSDISRFSGCDGLDYEKIERRVKKYEKARSILEYD